MVGANTFRNPALTAKMATTLDHMSNGRAILGIGGAWFEREHEAFGIDFGSGFGERLDLARRGSRAHARHAPRRDGDGARPALSRGQRRATTRRRSSARLPILIGGDGEKKTLHTVARYADTWNTGGDLEFVRHKDEVLRQWCERVGRDESEIERTLGLGLVIIRDDSGRGAAGRRRVPRAPPGLQRDAEDRDRRADRGIARAVRRARVPPHLLRRRRRRSTRRP